MKQITTNTARFIKDGKVMEMMGVSEAEKEWELIANVILSDSVTEVIIDKDLNGNDYQLNDLYIDLDVPKATINTYAGIWLNSKYAGEISNAIRSSSVTKSTFLRLEINGKLMPFSIAGVNNVTTMSYVNSFASPLTKKEITSHVRVRASYASNILLPANTVIKLYGVRS